MEISSSLQRYCFSASTPAEQAEVRAVFDALDTDKKGFLNASELRDAEKAENQETLERAEAGRASVANAIDILNSSPLPRGEVRSTSLCVGSNQARGEALCRCASAQA